MNEEVALGQRAQYTSEANHHGSTMAHDHDTSHAHSESHLHPHPRTGAAVDWKTNGVRVVPGHALDPNTAQTPGMSRATAINWVRAGAEKLWAGTALDFLVQGV